MRFDINRLSKLAGIPAGQKQTLNEASRGSWAEDPGLASEKDIQFGKGAVINETDQADDDVDESDKDLDEVIEVNEVDLVAELRRLRKSKLAESGQSRKRLTQQKGNQQLKTIIEHEVKNILQDIEDGKIDLNISSKWVYGNKQPHNSKLGYVTRAFKGIGFK